MSRRIQGQKPEAPRIACAYCGKRISPSFGTDTKWKADTGLPATFRTYNGKVYHRGYGDGAIVRFCNLSGCTLRFALAAYRAGYRIKETPGGRSPLCTYSANCTCPTCRTPRVGT